MARDVKVVASHVPERTRDQGKQFSYGEQRAININRIAIRQGCGGGVEGVLEYA